MTIFEKCGNLIKVPNLHLTGIIESAKFKPYQVHTVCSITDFLKSVN